MEIMPYFQAMSRNIGTFATRHCIISSCDPWMSDDLSLSFHLNVPSRGDLKCCDDDKKDKTYHVCLSRPKDRGAERVG